MYLQNLLVYILNLNILLVPHLTKELGINTYNITLLFPYPYFSLGISFPSMDKLGTPKSICPFNIFLKHFLVTNINQKIIFCIPETQFCPNVQANCLDYKSTDTWQNKFGSIKAY